MSYYSFYNYQDFSIRINFNRKNLYKEGLKTYVHEMTHFFQQISTTYGWNLFLRIESLNKLIHYYYILHQRLVPEVFKPLYSNKEFVDFPPMQIPIMRGESNSTVFPAESFDDRFLNEFIMKGERNIIENITIIHNEINKLLQIPSQDIITKFRDKIKYICQIYNKDITDKELSKILSDKLSQSNSSQKIFINYSDNCFRIITGPDDKDPLDIPIGLAMLCECQARCVEMSINPTQNVIQRTNEDSSIPVFKMVSELPDEKNLWGMPEQIIYHLPFLWASQYNKRELSIQKSNLFLAQLIFPALFCIIQISLMDMDISKPEFDAEIGSNCIETFYKSELDTSIFSKTFIKLLTNIDEFISGIAFWTEKDKNSLSLKPNHLIAYLDNCIISTNRKENTKNDKPIPLYSLSIEKMLQYINKIRFDGNKNTTLKEIDQEFPDYSKIIASKAMILINEWITELSPNYPATKANYANFGVNYLLRISEKTIQTMEKTKIFPIMYFNDGEKMAMTQELYDSSFFRHFYSKIYYDNNLTCYYRDCPSARAHNCNSEMAKKCSEMIENGNNSDELLIESYCKNDYYKHIVNLFQKNRKIKGVKTFDNQKVLKMAQLFHI